MDEDVDEDEGEDADDKDQVIRMFQVLYPTYNLFLANRKVLGRI